MRTDTESSFQMFRMHKKSCKFITVFVQSKKNADSHIVDAALHGSVHCGSVVIVVMFRTGRVELQITFFMVSFLEQDISADAGFLQKAVIIYRCSGNVDIDAPDGSVLMLDAVNGINTVQIIIHGIVHRILACFQSQTFVPHILQRNDFPPDFFLGQFFPCNMFILHMIRAVGTSVNAVVG